jgi:hypothetical protein
MVIDVPTMHDLGSGREDQGLENDGGGKGTSKATEVGVGVFAPRPSSTGSMYSSAHPRYGKHSI